MSKEQADRKGLLFALDIKLLKMCFIVKIIKLKSIGKHLVYI